MRNRISFHAAFRRAACLQLALLVFSGSSVLSPPLSAAADALTASTPAETRHGELSLVPVEERISDFEARLTLAELLSYRPGTQEQAAKELRILLGTAPTDGKTAARLADIAANIGHAGTAAGLYLTALQLPGATPELRQRFAGRMQGWGDYYAAEGIYRAGLKEHPNSRETLLALAQLLGASQRYEEAEGVYRALLGGNAGGREELEGLARIKAQQNDFAGSLAITAQALAIFPADPRFLRLEAATQVRAKKFPEALAAYRLLAKDAPFKAEAVLGMARIFIEKGDAASARPFIVQAAVLEPESVEAGFYRDWERVADRGYLREKLEGLGTPRQMEQLGGLYALHGYGEQAVVCYEAAVAREPRYFPARIELAGILAAMRRYDRSIGIYRQLDSEFPGNSKVMIGTARTLAWSKRYDQSLELYGKLERRNPLDPVPRKERARTAVWAKEIGKAAAYYDELLTPPVDRILVTSLDAPGLSGGDYALAKLRGELRRSADGGSVYQGYQALAEALANGALEEEPEQRRAVERTLSELLPKYLVQKGAALEKDAKLLAWNRRFLQAMERYDELLAFQPGNEEALFDRGQLACTIGLCGEAGKLYLRLLEMDPLHLLADEALSLNRANRRPAMKLAQSYWKEQGRGELSGIRRYRSVVGVSVPVFDDYNLSLAGNVWKEEPTRHSGVSYTGYGHTLALDGVINRFVSGAASWTRKKYDNTSPGLSDSDSGSAKLSFNLNDYLRWDLGYERSDELYNGFGIAQGIQSDSYWTGLSSNPSRKVSLAAKGGYLRYNDDNEGEFAEISAGYAFSDHPRTFKVSVGGEYRNTSRQNAYLYSSDGALQSITHPYWTPRNYFAESLSLEWNHDLSRLFFCGSERRFYGLRATAGTDSENNLSARWEAAWHYEFFRRWILSLNAMIQRSRQWDAVGGSLDIKYRF